MFPKQIFFNRAKEEGIGLDLPSFGLDLPSFGLDLPPFVYDEGQMWQFDHEAKTSGCCPRWLRKQLIT
ncbi:hypothetical protein DERP_002952 [Dermatophagoides pteronyssinus]|uniref:Uncharacterized protein n=1 Tax=Dermatophagoides pteronyssinus TaxID=6956 RepID=A0ABQ8JX77_DERPT|nr:hypothetical protein DERP_002952 [Dermatophagoides pteronyssinus]